jgi:hypothetical protein
VHSKTEEFNKRGGYGDACIGHCSISNGVQSDDEMVLLNRTLLIMWYQLVQA